MPAGIPIKAHCKWNRNWSHKRSVGFTPFRQRTGIGPETFAFISDDGANTGGDAPTVDQLAFYKQHGFYITGSDYYLRPDVLDSNFYAWRVTGNIMYINRAASAIESFNKYLPTTVGYQFCLVSGMLPLPIQPRLTTWRVSGLPKSWSICELIQIWAGPVAALLNISYSYLTFDDPNHISLDDCRSDESFVIYVYLFYWIIFVAQGFSTRNAIPSKHPHPRPHTPPMITCRLPSHSELKAEYPQQ